MSPSYTVSKGRFPYLFFHDVLLPFCHQKTEILGDNKFGSLAFP